MIAAMDWQELAEAQRRSAYFLFGGRESSLDRAVCGRAYYAAYALITSRLSGAIDFRGGWNNPPHARLPGYVGNLAELNELDRTKIRRALRRLRQRREDADYRPGITVDRVSARESLRDAGQVFAIIQQRSK